MYITLIRFGCLVRIKHKFNTLPNHGLASARHDYFLFPCNPQRHALHNGYDGVGFVPKLSRKYHGANNSRWRMFFRCLITHENVLFVNQLSYHMLTFYFDIIALFHAPTSYSWYHRLFCTLSISQLIFLFFYFSLPLFILVFHSPFQIFIFVLYPLIFLKFFFIFFPLICLSYLLILVVCVVKWFQLKEQIKTIGKQNYLSSM